ncbi:MAG: hypothetical protein HYR68_12845 [Burkholderiales bacterium]|nr:hypothetical protein [Burkholderiales bacterium]MBI3729801.1 hypothetical protein [Burkholderiales bacterium]
MHDKKNEDAAAIRLTAQHLSIMEVGSNARAFEPFLSFLGTKTLIITDFDSTKRSVICGEKGEVETGAYQACMVCDANNTSNYTLKHFYSAPVESDEFPDWFEKLKRNSLPCISSNIKVAFQVEENTYHARSFEDAFLHVNLEKIKSVREKLKGLKNKACLDDERLSTYARTNEVQV